jgi:hypothetical protein
MNRLISILLVFSLPSALVAATLADPPKDTGIAFKIIKVERIKESDKGSDLLTVRVANESKSNYWIMNGDKDPVERFSKGNSENLFYMLWHSYTTDSDEHYHIRKEGHWQRTHPLELRETSSHWVKIGPGEKKEISIPVADTLVDHVAEIALSLFFSRDADGRDRFYLVTKPVIIKAQQAAASDGDKPPN